jgi:hypothetical protein
MTPWSEDFSTWSIEEILRSQSENRNWNKQLRLRNTDLVNNRLAKRIEQEEYVLHRKLGHEDAAECKRRANLLTNEIASRA